MPIASASPTPPAPAGGGGASPAGVALAVLVDSGAGAVVVDGVSQLERARALLRTAFPATLLVEAATWDDVVRAGANVPGAVVVLDAVHALGPVSLLTDVADAAARRPGIAVASRAVTDTLKELAADGTIAATVDRARQCEVLTPIAFPGSLLGPLSGPLLGPLSGLLPDGFAPAWLVALLTAASDSGLPLQAVPAPAGLVAVARQEDASLVSVGELR